MRLGDHVGPTWPVAGDTHADDDDFFSRNDFRIRCSAVRLALKRIECI
jgi:hypothetical protein